jgi:flagellar biosynthesis GTPase FlhF
MSSIKQTIRNAIHQMYKSGNTYDDADVFCNDLFEILFAETSQTVTIPTIPEPPPAPAPAPAEPKKKLTKEEKAAEKAAKEEKKKADAEAKEAAKKSKEEAKKAKEKPSTANIEKLNPSQTKQLKAAAEKAKVPIAKDINKKFLEHVNKLSASEFNSKKLDEHMVDFVTPAPAPPAEDTEAVEAEWKGKSYWVDKEGCVYEDVDGTEKVVGRVGIAHFEGMKMPDF